MQCITMPCNDSPATTRKKGPRPTWTASDAEQITTETPSGNQDQIASKAVESIATEAPEGNPRSDTDQGPEANEAPQSKPKEAGKVARKKGLKYEKDDT